MSSMAELYGSTVEGWWKNYPVASDDDAIFSGELIIYFCVWLEGPGLRAP